MMMDAGWALTVFRFSMAVFFVMVLITALLACVHVAIDVSGDDTREFFGYGRFQRDCLAMARRIRPRLSDAWM